MRAVAMFDGERPVAVTFAFGNIKGGVGSTSLATNFAASLQRLGFRVVLIDTDVRGTATKWAARRDERRLPPVTAIRVRRDIDIREDDAADVLVIDVTKVRAELLDLFEVVDVWVAPILPSHEERNAAVRLHEAWERTALGSARQQCFVAIVCQVSSMTTSNAELRIREELSIAAPSLRVLRQSLTADSAWDWCFYGSSLHELPPSIARYAVNEWNLVFGELLAVCGRSIGQCR